MDRLGLGSLAKIATPIAFANLIQVAVVVTDSALLGRVDTTALAGAALASPLYLVALILLRSWSTAVQIVVAREHGAGSAANEVTTLTVGLAVSLLGGGLAAAVLVVLRAPLLGLLTDDPYSAAAGERYLAVLGWALPVMGCVLVWQAFENATGRARSTMYSNVVIGLTNLAVGIGLVLMAGLGVVGAGLATIVSAAAGLAFLVARRRDSTELGRSLIPHGHRMRVLSSLGRLAWPEAVLFVVGYANEVVVVAFVATLGEFDLAAYRLLDNLATVLYVLIAAASSALTVRLGQELGAGIRPMVGRQVREAAVVATGLTAPVVLAVLLAPTPLFLLFTPEPEVVDVATGAAPLMVLSMTPVIVTLCLAGAFRAYGRNRWLMMASLISDLVALVPLAWLLGVRWGFGVDGIYLAWLAFAVVNLVLVGSRFPVVARGGSVVRD